MDALTQGLGTITDENLKTALNNNIGEDKYEITGNETNGWTVTVDEIDYNIDATGNVTGGNTGGVNWNKILKEANKNPESMKHSEQVKSDFIGIGTDGEPVNMDFWRPTEAGEEWKLESVLSSYSQEAVYEGGIDDNGRINGKIPQYIYSEMDKKFKPVTNLEFAFYGCTGLEIAPEIPNTVTDMFGTFAECKDLVIASEIPSSVEDMRWTFMYCKKLTGEICINANSEYCSYYDCFSGTTQPIQLTGTCKLLSELAATSENGNVTVKK